MSERNHPMPNRALRDMRFVYTNPAEMDTTENHRNLRKMKDSDLGKFVIALQRLESEHSKARNEAAKVRATNRSHRRETEAKVAIATAEEKLDDYSQDNLEGMLEVVLSEAVPV